MPEPEVVAQAVETDAESTVEEVQEKLPEGSDATSAESATANEDGTRKDQVEGAEGTEKTGLRGLERRFKELTREKALAKLEAEFWRKKALGESAESEAESKKPEISGEESELEDPNPDNYETTQEYFIALADVRAERKLREFKKAEESKIRESKEREQEEINKKKWAEKEKEIEADVPDYKEKLQEGIEVLRASYTPAIQKVAEVIALTQEPRMLLYFAEHPEEVTALASLHPNAALMKLGVIQQRIGGKGEGTEAEERLPEVPPQKAPKPITPTRRSSPSTVIDPTSPESDKLSDEEWWKLEQKRMKSKGR